MSFIHLLHHFMCTWSLLQCTLHVTYFLCTTMHNFSHIFFFQGGEGGDLGGRAMRVVALHYVPYVILNLYKNECQGGPVTLQDSLDYRILNTLVAYLNFT